MLGVEGGGGLSFGGKVTLLNACLASTPVYHLSIYAYASKIKFVNIR